MPAAQKITKTAIPMKSPVASPVTSPADAHTAGAVTSPLTEAPVSSPVTSPTPQGNNSGEHYVVGHRHAYAALKLATYNGMNYERKPAPYTGLCSDDTWAYT